MFKGKRKKKGELEELGRKGEMGGRGRRRDGEGKTGKGEEVGEREMESILLTVYTSR